MDYWSKNSVAVFLILALSFLIELLKKRKLYSMLQISNIDQEKSSIGSVLLIIAHPDDEIMFWSPTIKTFQKYKISLKILCLSNGNYDGLGEIREKEFDNMSLELKLFDNQLINVPELQDNIKQKWDKEEVAKQIKEMINSNNDIKTIITFDEKGVTKHPNHISCNEGLKFFLESNKDEVKSKGIKVYFLDSFNFAVQYTFFIPFMSYVFKSYGYFTMTFFSSYKWMSFYKSQFTLMRKAHVILSGYSYFNTYTKYEY